MIIVSTRDVTEAVADPGVIVDGPGRDVATLTYTWVGWTGRSWALTDPAGPVSKLRGATGFGFADETHYWFDALGVPGSSWEGSRTERGHLFLPMVVRGSDSADFLVQEREFLKTLDPKEVGTMIVTTPDQQARWSRCRYVSGADAPVDVDPVASCAVRYGIGWDRAEPYWHGEDQVATYIVDTPLPFFAPPGQVPPAVLNISSADNIETGTITNPGNVESDPRWRVTGPCTAFAVGVAGAKLSMTVTLTADQSISIDMNPDQLTILDNTGADRWKDLTDVDFAAIPPGFEVPLSMSLTGTGSIELSFPTNYRNSR